MSINLFLLLHWHIKTIFFSTAYSFLIIVCIVCESLKIILIQGVLVNDNLILAKICITPLI